MRKYSPILIAVVALSGCIGLTPSKDPTRFYLIAPPSSSDAPDGATFAGHQLSIGIRRIDTPDYLNSSKIAVRSGGYEIVYSEFNRWGEDMERAIARTIAHSLETSQGVNYVSIFPWPAELNHDCLLRLRFSNFEGADDGLVRIAGEWSVVDSASRSLLHLESFDMQGSWTPGDYESLAAALSELVYKLGKNIAGLAGSIEVDQSGQPVSRNSQGN